MYRARAGKACGLALLAALGCAGTEKLGQDLDALAERQTALSARIDDLGREIKKVENRLTAGNNAAAQDYRKQLEQFGLTVSRVGKEVADLRQEFGRTLDERERTLQGVVKEQEKTEAARAAQGQAANERAIGALREELAQAVGQLTQRLDALAVELKRSAAAASAPAAPPAVKEGAEL